MDLTLCSATQLGRRQGVILSSAARPSGKSAREPRACIVRRRDRRPECLDGRRRRGKRAAKTIFAAQVLARCARCLLLIVSLAVSAALTGFGNYLDSILPFGQFLFPAMNFLVSLLPISVLFAVIYKVLPDRQIEWRDVVVGGVVTAVLFNIGKSLIGWYIGSSAVASSYGAAGALIVLLLWVYYSIQLFLLGAEFTKIYANHHGSMQTEPVAAVDTTTHEAITHFR
jgi:uncharacterized BrkB/YihY/UPF0761 family membrane protein